MTVQVGEGAAGLLDFRGQLLRPDMVLFVAPPPEIGAIRSCESTLRQGKAPMAIWKRALLVMTCVIVPVATWAAIMVPRSPDRQMPNFWTYTAIACCFIGFLVAMIAAPLVWYLTRFKASCAYVGEEGMVRYTIRSRLNNKPTSEFLRFADATELRTRQTRHYWHGMYAGTKYQYRWTNPGGKPLLQLKGSFMSERGDPKPPNPFHFAVAAEAAWSEWLLRRADGELAEYGYLTFPVDTKRKVIVGPGYIEFQFGSRKDRCDAADIKAITLSRDAFAVIHRDARWYSSKGKFSLAYNAIPNAQFFVLVIERFLPPATWAPPHDSGSTTE